MDKWTAGDVAGIITDPFHAINFDPSVCEPHEPTVAEDVWVKTNVRAIEELGAEQWLRVLLTTLQQPKAPIDPGVAAVGNPHHAVEIHPVYGEPHEPLVDEGTWIAANFHSIQDLGPEAWLRNLLVVLKGVTLRDTLPEAEQAESADPDVGRNDPCPCGSGRKYKRCHGR